MADPFIRTKHYRDEVAEGLLQMRLALNVDQLQLESERLRKRLQRNLHFSTQVAIGVSEKRYSGFWHDVLRA